MSYTISQSDFEFAVQKAVKHFNEDLSTSLIGMCKASFDSCNANDLSIKLVFPFQSWQDSGYNHVFAGALSAIATVACGILNQALGDNILPTLSQSENFVRSVPCGKDFIVTAKAQMIGRSTKFFISSIALKEEPNKVLVSTNAVLSGPSQHMKK